MRSLWQQASAEMAAVAERTRQALVHIRDGQGSGGTGTIWHPDGLIITNAHVLHSRSPRVTLSDRRVLPARILAHNAGHDLAALVIEASGLPTIELGDSRRLRPGNWVMALGHPWGVASAVTFGIVIGVGIDWPEMPLPGREWVMVNLHLRPGYSGGPLVDSNGRLVGINTMMTGPDVGAAVPVHAVKSFLREALRSNS
jgi:serine protease Do